jgi:hypothetical protein
LFGTGNGVDEVDYLSKHETILDFRFQI